MLVAVILISLLIGIATFALKYELIAIHKTKKIGINKVITYNQIRSSVQSMKYYIVDDYDMLGYPMEQLHPFFDATKTEITYITQNPLFSQDEAVAQIKCEDNKLVYTEERLYANIDFLRPEILETSRRKILYDNLNDCSFSYLFKIEIPSSVTINLSKNNQVSQIYINVKSDYNRSIGLVRDAMYPLK